MRHAELETGKESPRVQERIDSLPILILHAHSSCNCRCVMCDIWKTPESKAFTLETLERCMPSIRRLRVRWVVLSGGEPLLNPEWPMICRELKKEGVRVTLLSTGLLLGKYAGQICANCDEVIVSLDGPQAVHDEIRRVPKAFSLLESGVSAVKELAPRFRITARTTVQKTNRLHLQATVEAAKALGLDGISFLAADLTSHAFNRPQLWSLDRQREVGLSNGELEELREEVETLIATRRAEIESGFVAESPEKLRRIVQQFRVQLGGARPESPLCNAPWVSAVVETDGTVRPCFFHRAVGNLTDRSLEEVVNGREALGFRASLDVASNPTCNRCVCSLNYRGNAML
jgi:Fe-coproporphyrin III synthase